MKSLLDLAACSFFCCFSEDQPGHALPSFATPGGLSGHLERPRGPPRSFLNRASEVRVLPGAPILSLSFRADPLDLGDLLAGGGCPEDVIDPTIEAADSLIGIATFVSRSLGLDPQDFALIERHARVGPDVQAEGALWIR